MFDAEWIAHRNNNPGHQDSDRVDVLIPEGWLCRANGARCKGRSRSMGSPTSGSVGDGGDSGA